MASFKCILGVVVLLLASVWAQNMEEREDPLALGDLPDGGDDGDMTGIENSGEEKTGPENSGEEKTDPDNSGEVMTDPDNSGEEKTGPENDEEDLTLEDDLSVSERLEQANKNLERDGDNRLEDGDIAVPESHVHKRNADKCVRHGCKWPRHSGGKVYVPYILANQYSSAQIQVIKRAFASFATSTCIRFIPRTSQRDFLYIYSANGCWSYIGRRGKLQRLSLKSSGCVYLGTIQHELLHALGFNHEHKRSDRDSYIRVLWDNIIPNMKHNFQKVQTLNQGTPYDYGSVMHYRKTAFTRNGKPTLVARDGRSQFGYAREMSECDIQRVNSLYC